MNTAETDQKLKEAFSHAVPDVLNLVLSDCQKQKGSDMKMKDSGPALPLLHVSAAAAPGRAA